MGLKHIPIVEETPVNDSVPAGHRSKCRKCGAVDKVRLVGSRRLKRCAYCGSTIAMRRAPRKPKIISYLVCYQMDGQNIGMDKCIDRSQAEVKALFFVEHGSPARQRIAMIVELCDDQTTGNVRVLRYNNFRQRRSVTSWQGGCAVCKGKGLIPTVVRPSFGDRKAVVKFLPCTACHALGGELTRKQMFGRRITA